MAETGRLIHGRYLLQRLIKQGRACAVYQGVDQVLQRAVAVKVVPSEHMPAYRASIRATAQFAHPNIIGTYDLIIEPDLLYVVQEYVDGDDFQTLLQSQLSSSQVTDLGLQVCKALMYACSSSRKVCHGDLTPDAVIRDRWGLVRVNNFALPSNLSYFTEWNTFGGGGEPVSDRGLPWGQFSDGRCQDDSRAVGLLLYQLLAGRPTGAVTVEPPADGRLRFHRNVPAELCDIVARSVVRQHPQHITTVEALQAELRLLAERFEPPVPEATNYQTEEVVPVPQFSPARAVTSLPNRETPQAGTGMAAYRNTSAPLADAAELSAGALTMMDRASEKLVNAGPPVYTLPDKGENFEAVQPRNMSLTVMLLLGLLVFVLFFVVGFFLERIIFP